MKLWPKLLLALAAFSAALAFASAQPSSSPAAEPLTPAEQKAADLRLPQLDRSALTPNARKPVEVKPNERNPFARAAGKVSDEAVPTAQPVTEQKRIERVLRAMRVGGVLESAPGRRVLLGPMSLGSGEEVPRLFVNQVETLVVDSIDDRKVVLRFSKPDPSGGKRLIILPFDIKSSREKVEELLPGELMVKKVPLDADGLPAFPALTNVAADAMLKAAEQQNFRGLVDRQTEMFTAPAVPAKDESKKKKP
jgi:hypothetical protein